MQVHVERASRLKNIMAETHGRQAGSNEEGGRDETGILVMTSRYHEAVGEERTSRTKQSPGALKLIRIRRKSKYIYSYLENSHGQYWRQPGSDSQQLPLASRSFCQTLDSS